MKELIEKIRQKFLEKEKIIESQVKEVQNAKMEVKRLNGVNARLYGEIMAYQLKLKRFNELMKEAGQE